MEFGNPIIPVKLTTAERDALTAVLGMVIDNTTTGNLERYNGSSWVGTGDGKILYSSGDTNPQYFQQKVTDGGDIVKIATAPPNQVVHFDLRQLNKPIVLARDPLVTDDDSITYLHRIGQTWVNTVTGDVFIAEDLSTGAAVWVQVNGTGGASLFDDLTDVTQDFTSATAVQVDDGKIAHFDIATKEWVTDEAVTHGTVVINGKTSVATSTIAKGLPVYVDGFDNDLHVVEVADADGAGTFPCIGFTAEALDDTNSKHIVTFGKLTGIDTTSTVSTLNPNGETWVQGDSLYLSTTPGGLTDTRPTGVTEIQRIAQVLNVHATGGQLFIFNTARTAGLPNLAQDKYWVGDANGYPVETPIPTASEQAAVQVNRSTSLVVTSTPTDFTFDSADVENLPLEVSWDIANPERITVLQDSLYQISASLEVDNSSNTNETLELELFVNGVTTGETVVANITKNGAAELDPLRVAELSANDYISFKATQTTGSGDITINADAKLVIVKLQGTKGDTGATGAGSNIIVQDEGVTQGTVVDTLDFTGGGVTVTESAGTATVTIPSSSWQPNSVPLGAVLTSGAAFFINGGAGTYLSLSGTADDSFYFNDYLSKANTAYDGSDLALVLHCRLSSNGVGGDDVGLLLDYAIVKNGDNSTTTVTNVAQVDYDVSTEIQDEEFDIQLSTMTGVVGAESIFISVTRNSTGAQADSYGGALEITGLNLVIV